MISKAEEAVGELLKCGSNAPQKLRLIISQRTLQKV